MIDNVLTFPTKKSLENRLVEENQGIVTFIAGCFQRRIGGYMTLDEITAVGMTGLLDSIRRFDPTRGVEFKTFAEFRVRGAILDHLRTLDLLPRSVRDKVKGLSTAMGELERMLKRRPTNLELAEYMDIPLEQIFQLQQDNESKTFIPAGAVESSLQTDKPGPEEIVEQRQQVHRILEAASKLEPRSSRILLTYFIEEKTMKEIAAMENLTESRVCQIIDKTVRDIQSNLSRAEVAVAEQVLKGISNQEVADKLHICEKTVKFHLTNIYRKSEVGSREKLIAKFHAAGYAEARTYAYVTYRQSKQSAP